MLQFIPERQAIEALKAATGEDFTGMSEQGWTFIDANGAIVLLKGNEVHVGVPPSVRGRWFSRADFKALFGSLLQVYGLVKTTVRNSNAAGHKFVRRLGFRESYSDDQATSYVLTEVKYEAV